jgi:GNAT superfamily N-acetyltransferase/predicted nucleic acid-binding protein
MNEVTRFPTNLALIKDEEEGQNFLDTIIDTADRNTEELGFLRGSVYEEALALGRLWILSLDGRYCGHLLFGGSRPTLHVKQLHIANHMRSRGLARFLVDQLIAYGEAEGYLSIRARVATDLPANKAWERLGFEVLSVVAGGKSTGRMINCRFRRLSPRGKQTTMLAALESVVNSNSLIARGMPVNRAHWYTIDINVWLDFALKRLPFHDAAHALIEGATRGDYRLRFTREAKVEAQRNMRSEQDPLMAIAETWQTVPDANAVELDDLVEQLRTIFFPERSRTSRHASNDLSDLKHVAMSIHAGATGFITREKALLARHDTVQRQYGLEILSPTDLLEFREPSLAPLSPLQAGIKIDLLPQRLAAATAMVRETISRRARLRPIDSEDEGWVCSFADQVVGVVFWKRSRRVDTEAYLAIDRIEGIDTDRHQRIFDILLGLLVADAPSTLKFHKVLLRTDLDTRDRYYQDFRRIGFFDTSDQDLFLRFVSGDPVAFNEWTMAKGMVDHELNAESEWNGNTSSGPILTLHRGTSRINLDRFSFETFFGISALTVPGRRVFFVPITEHFSQELLPRPWRPPLFKQNDASFRSERVYFRNPRSTYKLKAGDLLLFYVTEPISALVGLARCTVSEVLDHGEASERFRRLAVIDPAEVGTRVHCIAFDNYIHFRRRVTLQWLGRHGAKPSNNFQTISSMRDEVDLLEIIREGLPPRESPRT